MRLFDSFIWFTLEQVGLWNTFVFLLRIYVFCADLGVAVALDDRRERDKDVEGAKVGLVVGFAVGLAVGFSVALICAVA